MTYVQTLSVGRALPQQWLEKGRSVAVASGLAYNRLGKLDRDLDAAIN